MTLIMGWNDEKFTPTHTTKANLAGDAHNEPRRWIEEDYILKGDERSLHSPTRGKLCYYLIKPYLIDSRLKQLRGAARASLALVAR
jgi:hypothetical protein